MDIRADALAAALDTLRAEGVEADGLRLDLADRDAYARAADRVEDVYGEPPHLLFNTAGVFAIGPTSLGGFFGADGVAVYSASKAAVVSLMESYRPALAKYHIGVSVLCPMNINSNIGLSSQVRPPRLRASGYVANDATTASLQRLFAQGMDPVELATHVKAGNPDAAAPLQAHFEEVIAAVPAEATDPEGVAKRTAALRNWAAERDEIVGLRGDDAAPEVRSAPTTSGDGR